MALADDRELLGRRQAGCVSRNRAPSFFTPSSLTIGDGIQASASLAARATGASESPAIQIGGPPGCLGFRLACTLLSVW
jgi:hypothetical protein